MKKIRLIVAAALVSSASLALASDIYVAASIGQSDFGSSQGDIDSSLRSAGATNVVSSFDKHGTAFKLQLGYQFDPHWAIEGGYVDLGKTTYNASFTGGSANAEVKASGWNIEAVGTLPINEKFSLFGKIGVLDGKVETSAIARGNGGIGAAGGNGTKWRPTYGFGVKYDVSKSFGIVGEFEHFDKLGDDNTTGTGSVNLLSAGILSRF